MVKRIKLIENMNTFQGEGPDAGRRVLMIRYKNCDRVINRKPCPFCDTLVKMRVSNEAECDLQDLQDNLDNFKCGILLTGGEPTYGEYFDSTLEVILNLNYSFINIETNGYQLPKLLDKINDFDIGDKDIKIIYSPKFFTKMELNDEIERTKKIISKLGNVDIYFKIVFDGGHLTEEYLDFISLIDSINDSVYLMPEGKTREELLINSGQVFDACEFYKFNFSSREHVVFDFI
jgi:organic radical activating enzyme